MAFNNNNNNNNNNFNNFGNVGGNNNPPAFNPNNNPPAFNPNIYGGGNGGGNNPGNNNFGGGGGGGVAGTGSFGSGGLSGGGVAPTHRRCRSLELRPPSPSASNSGSSGDVGSPGTIMSLKKERVDADLQTNNTQIESLGQDLSQTASSVLNNPNVTVEQVKNVVRYFYSKVPQMAKLYQENGILQLQSGELGTNVREYYYNKASQPNPQGQGQGFPNPATFTAPLLTSFRNPATFNEGGTSNDGGVATGVSYFGGVGGASTINASGRRPW